MKHTLKAFALLGPDGEFLKHEEASLKGKPLVYGRSKTAKDGARLRIDQNPTIVKVRVTIEVIQ